jgi:hypothetical protein
MKMETILFRTPLANLYMQCVCGCEGNTCECANEHKFGVATNHGKLSRRVRQTVATDKTEPTKLNRTCSTNNRRHRSPSSARKTTRPTGTARQAVIEFSDRRRTEPHRPWFCVSFFFLYIFPFYPQPKTPIWPIKEIMVMNKCPKFSRAIYQEWQMRFDLIWF